MITKSILAAASAVFLTLSAQAVSITLGGPLPSFRTATLADAVAGSGRTGSGNATAAVVSLAYGSTWTERGDVAGNGGPGSYSDGMLNVVVSSGSWGGNGPLNGTWTVSPTFWPTYVQGAISLHVGNGGGEPDHFIWQLTPNVLSGTWSYDGTGIGGGGLSNLKLYSQGLDSDTPPPRVPDSGSTLALLGLAVAALAFAKRKF